MTKKILCIEDDQTLIDAFYNAISDMNENDMNLSGMAFKTRSEALHCINDNNLIGIIIDLNLGSDGITSGVHLIESLAKNFNKIPIAIYSGTTHVLKESDNKLLEGLCIKIYTKDDANYDDIIRRFIKISDTGINKVLGDKGIIEKKLFDIFQKEILPNIDSWIKCKSEVNLEEHFTRHAINYLHHIIDTSHADYLSIEFYLNPKIINNDNSCVQTGEIYKNLQNGQYYFVITPACDLESKKSPFIHLLTIESKEDTIKKKYPNLDYSEDLKTYSPKQQKQIREKLYSNNENFYLHYLPKVEKIFQGGFINFRAITTISSDTIREYEKELHVSPQFVKDIVARFSNYYARQGQPEIYDKKPKS